jgi:hypothetical protein
VPLLYVPAKQERHGTPDPEENDRLYIYQFLSFRPCITCKHRSKLRSDEALLSTLRRRVRSRAAAVKVTGS